MANGVKSVLLAAALIVVWQFVLGGESSYSGWGGRPRWDFCDSLSDVAVIGGLPCIVLNLGVVLATLASIIVVYAIISRLWR